MNPSRAITKAFNEKFDDLTKAKAAMKVGLPKSLPPECEIIITTGNSLRIGMPLDPELMNYVRREFRKLNWEVGDFEVWDWGGAEGALATLRAEQEEDQTLGKRLNHCDIVGFDWKEGSTCKVELIGTEMIEQNVYERRCKEDEEPVIA